MTEQETEKIRVMVKAITRDVINRVLVTYISGGAVLLVSIGIWVGTIRADVTDSQTEIIKLNEYKEESQKSKDAALRLLERIDERTEHLAEDMKEVKQELQDNKEADHRYRQQNR